MRNLLFIVTLFIISFKSATAILCYQCNGTDPKSLFQCGEDLGAAGGTIDLAPQSCDKVHDAKYCIKLVGRNEVSSILCYQCNVTTGIECSDWLIAKPGGKLKPSSCEHVHDAQFCIKSTALYGGVGAKRYCSSKDLGNYCNDVKQPGDQLTYRTCIYTCNTDGCNSAHSLNLNFSVILMLAGVHFVFTGLRRIF